MTENETVLAYGLEKRGLQVKRQEPIKLRFEDIVFDEGFRADILVEDTLKIIRITFINCNRTVVITNNQ